MSGGSPHTAILRAGRRRGKAVFARRGQPGAEADAIGVAVRFFLVFAGNLVIIPTVESRFTPPNIAVRRATLSRRSVMRFARLLLPAISALVLLAVGTSLDAQTGPIKKKKDGDGGSGPTNPAPVGPGTELTPERITKLLQGKGAATEMKTLDNKNNKITRITAKLEQDDFRYNFDVVFVVPPKGQAMWYFTAVLNKNAKDLPVDKLQGLLKENNVMAGDCAFMITPDWQLQLNSRSYAGIITDQLFNGDINRYLKDVRETANLWYTDK
jgi:hypothetical protein